APWPTNFNMEIRDKNLKQKVDVVDALCLKRSCYWPRPDPGVFTQGQGYRSRHGKRKWLCGTREIHGCRSHVTCPEWGTKDKELTAKCRECGHDFANVASDLSPTNLGQPSTQDSQARD